MDGSAADSTSQGSYMQRLWTCPVCEAKLAVNMAEQLQHQANCKKDIEDALKREHSSSQDPALLKEYHCGQCGETLQLTSIDILKHKREHARAKVTS